MSWKKVIILLLLLAAAVGIPYFSYLDGQLDHLGRQITAGLERRLQAEISYEEVSLLPLNRISVRDLDIEAENYSLSVPELEIYYDLSRFLSRLYEERLEIELVPAFIDNLEVITAGQPEVKIRNPEGEILQLEDDEDDIGDMDLDPDQIWNTLPSLPAGAEMVISEASLSYQEGDRSFEAADLRLEYYSPARDEMEAAFSGDFSISGLQHPLFKPDNFDVAELEMSTHLKNDSWQLDGELKLPDVSGLMGSLIEERLESAGHAGRAVFDVGDFSEKIELSLSGSGSDLSRLQIEGEGGAEKIGYFPAETFGEIDKVLTAADSSWRWSYDSELDRFLLPELDFSLAGGEFSGQGFLDIGDPLEDFSFDLSGHDLDWEQFIAALPDGFFVDDKFEKMDISDFSPGRGSLEIAAVSAGGTPELEIDVKAPDVEMGEEVLAGGLGLSWRQGEPVFYSADLDFTDHRPAGLKLEGSLAGSDETLLDLLPGLSGSDLIYEFSLAGRGIEAEMLERTLPGLPEKAGPGSWPESGRLDFSAEGSGRGITAENLQIGFEADLRELSAAGLTPMDLSTEIWYGDGLLEIGSFSFDGKPGAIKAAGSYNPDEEMLDISFDTDEIDLDELASQIKMAAEELGHEIDRPELTGRADLAGSVKGNISAPEVEAVLDVPAAEIYGADVRQGGGELYFDGESRVLKIENAVYDSREAEIFGGGAIDFSAGVPDLDLSLDVDNMSYEYINDLFEIALPLEGRASGTVDIVGPVDDLEVIPAARSESTVFSPDFAPDIEIEFVNASADMYWRTGEPYRIKELTMERESAEFTLAGSFEEEVFNASYSVSDYQLEYLSRHLPEFEQDLSGIGHARGNASGSYSDPEYDIDFELAELTWQDHELGELSGKAHYQDDALLVDRGDWLPGSGRIRLSGRVDNLLDEPELDIDMSAEDLRLDHYLAELGYDLEMELPYYVSGQASMEGTYPRPNTDVDLQLAAEDETWGRINLTGTAADSFDLELTSSDIRLERLSEFLPEGYGQLEGEVELAGRLTGPLEAPEAELSTEIAGFALNDYRINEVKGLARLDEDLILELDQEFITSAGDRLELEALVPLAEERQDARFELAAEDFPFAVTDEFLPGLNALKGEFRGRVSGRGDIEEPELEGSLEIDLDEFSLPDQRPVSGRFGLDFSGSSVEFMDVSAEMNGGEIDGSGRLNLFSAEDFWNLSFQLDEIPLAYEESSAEFTGDVNIAGSRLEPLITGELRFDNMEAVLPEEEIEMAADAGETDPGRFRPELEITIEAGENNFARHENAEFRIQEGSLLLTYREQFALDGSIDAGDGWAFVYNNRFTIQEAGAEFSSARGVIPRVRARAETRIEGNDITVTIDGTPDNISTTFSSVPEMTEEEILTLLARRGGVGGLLEEDERSLGGLVQREAFRWISETLHTSLLEWQRSIRERLDLDTFEVRTYELGWDEEVTLFIGHNVTDRLYIETETEFNTDERETELKLDYALTDRISLSTRFLDMSLDGWDGASIGLEMGLDF